jgi:hypothetical protein
MTPTPLDAQCSASLSFALPVAGWTPAELAGNKTAYEGVISSAAGVCATCTKVTSATTIVPLNQSAVQPAGRRLQSRSATQASRSVLPAAALYGLGNAPGGGDAGEMPRRFSVESEWGWQLLLVEWLCILPRGTKAGLLTSGSLARTSFALALCRTCQGQAVSDRWLRRRTGGCWPRRSFQV